MPRGRSEATEAWISSVASMLFERAQSNCFIEEIPDEMEAAIKELSAINEGIGFMIRWHEKDQQDGWDYIKDGVSLAADEWEEAIKQARELFQEFILKPVAFLLQPPEEK